ncbi:MAG: hypothetical protein Q7S34_02250 [bacterium]|nr:hypothetical protein [bacterium]
MNDQQSAVLLAGGSESVVASALVKAALELQNGKTSRKAKPVVNSNNGAPDMSLLETSGMITTDEDKAKLAAETAARKAFSAKALGALNDLENELYAYENIEGGEHDNQVQGKIRVLRDRIAKIRTAGGGHLSFAEFLDVIREADEESMEYVLEKLTTEVDGVSGKTRYHVANKDEVHKTKSAMKGKLPLGSFDYLGVFYIPNFEALKDKSDGQKAVESEVNKTVTRLKMESYKVTTSKSAAIRINSEYADFPANLLKVHQPIPDGAYRLEVEEFYTFKPFRSLVHEAGILVVRVKNRTIKTDDGEKVLTSLELVDGTGSADAIACAGAKKWKYTDKAGKMFLGHLVLSVGQILAKTFSAPRNCRGDECVQAVTTFAQLAKSGIISAWKKNEQAGMTLAKVNDVSANNPTSPEA